MQGWIDKSQSHRPDLVNSHETLGYLRGYTGIPEVAIPPS